MAAPVSFNKKTDMALAFNPHHDRMLSLRKACPSYATFSHMADAYTSTVPMVSAVEVKRHGGSAEDAELQLGIWQAAALSHLHSMFVGVDGTLPAIPIQIGWTVIGHTWAFYITWRDGAHGGSTVSLTNGHLSKHAGACLLRF